MESSIPVQVARYSLAIRMIEDKIEHETVDSRIITFNKPSEFSCTDCDYVVASNFSSYIESVKFFIMVH